ncbi:MAG: glycosyltransferase family 4 protein [Candidatus Sabulitectum sp.]|nr:glycosyltransferase family 4 protein [Candidatus Sabulitectum sp.]
MKIGIDVSPLYMNTSGISNYVRYLLQGLATAGGKHSFVLYTNKVLNMDTDLPDNFRIKVVRLPFPKFQAWFQLGLPLRLRCDGVNVFLGTFHRLPLFSRIPSVLTIHDLSGLLLKDYHLRSVVVRNSLLPLFIRKARRIIAVSQFTADEIVRNFPGVKGRMDVVLEAPAPGLTRVEQDSVLNEVRNDLKLPDRYILFLGTLEPRKNLPRLLKAYASIAHRIPQDIVLAGRMGWGSNQLNEVLKRNDIRDRIHLTGFVEDQQLPALISMADIMAYPALYEGFGLPVVEAMACGTPVLTSSVSSLPEAAGGAALLADPESVEDIAENLLKLADSSDLRRDLALKGLARVSRLSWEVTARMILDSCCRTLQESGKKVD